MFGAGQMSCSVLESGSESTPKILFAGHHLSGHYLDRLLEHLEGQSVFVNVISKSGTTLEPAVAFRIVREWLEDRFPDADDRVIVTTDAEKGALNVLQREKGYRKYRIPDNVGGRFSVLTPVGLLPIAVAGIDIRSLYYGAVVEYRRLLDTQDNPALHYAAYRTALFERGYAIEVMSLFEPRLAAFGGWWQQLFGESEGKDGKGLFPAVMQFTTDLHSLGQYMQDGTRNVSETFLHVADPGYTPTVPADDGSNADGLAYLEGQSLATINRFAYEGTLRAHLEGGVPVSTVTVDDISPASLGGAIYFFEHAVGVGGYMLGVNPFDQPGVERYKNEMFRLLGKQCG
jgi:glucose-6-phosphate isomerase